MERLDLSKLADMLTSLSSITATQLNINGATAETSLADTDEFLLYDASATANRKVTGANLKTYVGGSGLPSGTEAQVIVYNASNEGAAVALSGDATIVANGTLTIANNAISSAKIGGGQVTAAKLAVAAVQSNNLAALAVGTAQLGNAGVTAAKLASDAVTTVKLLDANVTTAKLADDAVTTAKVLDANVTTAKLADDAVTSAKLADYPTTAGTLDASKLLVCDSNKDLTGGRNTTLTGTLQAAEVAVGSSKWKWVISGNNLLLQYWSGSAWVTKQTFEPS